MLRFVLAAVLAVSLFAPASAQSAQPTSSSTCDITSIQALKLAGLNDAQDDNFAGATDKFEKVIAGLSACTAQEPDHEKQLEYRFNVALTQGSIALVSHALKDDKKAQTYFRSAMFGMRAILQDKLLSDEGRSVVTDYAQRVYDTCTRIGLSLEDRA